MKVVHSLVIVLALAATACGTPRTLTGGRPHGGGADVPVWVDDGFLSVGEEPIRRRANDNAPVIFKLDNDAGIDGYSERCLRRVWRAERFSWWFTSLMHKFPETGDFGQKMQAAELDYLVHSTAASTALAENYVGLPL